jgi:hypothetical protein
MESMGDHLLVNLPGGAVLAFGLRWFPLVGSRVDVMARKKSREERATHYVHGGTRAAAVGCARLRGRMKACYAAAQVFAQAHGHGTAAALLVLEDQRAWLVAAQDGAVITRTDRIYSTAGQAMDALIELDASYPGLSRTVLHMDLNGLAAALDPAACLWRTGSVLAQVPGPVRGAALLLMLALLVSAGLKHGWPDAQRKPAGTATIDPSMAWHLAIARAAAATRVHQPEQLGEVFGALKQLPTAVRGWALSSARCRPQAQDWACSASYARVGPHATNQELAAAIPGYARPVFRDLEQAQVAWRMPGTSAPLEPAALAGVQSTDIILASSLQRIRPAFARIGLGDPSALAVPAPRDEQGRPLPPPPDLPRIRLRNVTLQGPLRSFALFAQPAATASWSEITLALGSPTQPALARSQLTAQVTGIVYERE